MSVEIDDFAQKIFGGYFCCSEKMSSSKEKSKSSINGKTYKTTENFDVSRRPISIYQPSGHLDQRSSDMNMYKLKKSPDALISSKTLGCSNSLRACVAAENALVGGGSYPASGSLTPRAFLVTTPSPPTPAPVRPLSHIF